MLARRFLIPHLADENNFRILSKEQPQRFREREPDGLPDLNLEDSQKVDLNGILVQDTYCDITDQRINAPS